MAGERSVPDAPLSHFDEEAHRRLIATRANAIGYEEGLFTPTLSFATPGDLSVVYVQQEGYYWRVGPLVYFEALIQATPTFTTATGALLMPGLPFACKASLTITPIFASQLSSAGLTLPGGRTSVYGYMLAGESQLRAAAQGSAIAPAALLAADITSAVSLNNWVIQGCYPFI